MTEEKSLNDLFGKRNKNIVEAFLKELSMSTGEFKEWINKSSMFYDIVGNLKQSLDDIRDMDDKISQLKKYYDEKPVVKIIEVDLKENNIDISEWEGNEKPVKVILSCLLPEDNSFKKFKELSDVLKLDEKLYSLELDLMVSDMVVVMEDGTFQKIK